jgi:sulfite reductase (ferredoxin)
MTNTSWKSLLHDRIDEATRNEIDAFEHLLERRKRGEIDERVFAEARLRRGAYGQRYDRGTRFDGERIRAIGYFPLPSKGAGAAWDAPGMQRIKLPWGGLESEQMRVIADVADDYADGIVHITTRQDVQLHFVHIEDTPDLMRRLAAAGITTKEACGNSVRNVTACPIAGVCHDEAFDVTPYAEATKASLLGHADVQGFGRKLKISFSGCGQHACGLARMHDIGLIAKVGADGGPGFEVFVGGGLGSLPHEAQLLYRLLPAGDLLPVAHAICRVFARHGEKKNRGKARLKFLVAKIGAPEIRRLVEEELLTQPQDPTWGDPIAPILEHRVATEPLVQIGRPLDGFLEWRGACVRPQRQPGFSVVTIALPLGDLSSRQLRALADLADTFSVGSARTTVEQNLVVRFVEEQHLVDLHRELARVGLADPIAGTIADVTACPGTDTCKLGIASSRGLAGELRTLLAEREMGPAESLRVKISGCFNSCGQHHIADIGLYGVSRKKDDRPVPCFQIVLGGKWEDNAGAFGVSTIAIPSKRIAEALLRITSFFAKERIAGESFAAFVERKTRSAFRELLEDLAELPAFEDAPDLYTDTRDPRPFSLEDMGIGEGKGTLVSRSELLILKAESELLDADRALERGEGSRAEARARDALATIRLAFEELSVEEDRGSDPRSLIEKARYLVEKGRTLEGTGVQP